jgi:hypothetical protein
MRRLTWLLPVLLITSSATFGCDSSTEPARCTRPAEGSPCAQGTTVTREDGAFGPGWHVALRTTVQNSIAYQDGGRQCSFTRTRCVTEHCYTYGDVSQSEALASCKRQYGR